MNVVVIRTAGNQRYIFSSNKRQEIVGASELISRVDRVWVYEALRKIFQGYDEGWRMHSHPAELLMAGAGGITVLVEDETDARRLVTEVTCRALLEAPGLDVCGVVVGYGRGRGRGEGKDGDGDKSAGAGSERRTLAEAIHEAQAELTAVRESRPGPQARFLRLPLVEECSSNGLPASVIVPEGDEPARPRSAVAKGKLDAFTSKGKPDAFESAFKRLAELAPIAEPPREGATTDGDRHARRAMRRIVDRLGLEAEWVAVVHADGNALGEFFRRLRERAQEQDDVTYAERMRQASKAVDDCARAAFRSAWRATRAELREKDGNALVSGEPPILPLVLGGDDLTVVCEGRAALTFTRHYLEEFEKETAKGGWTAEGERTHLTAAAGVAIVKRNYPFHFAYELAEELLEKEAKTVKSAGSAVAFAVLLDSAAADLKRLRASYWAPAARRSKQASDAQGGSSPESGGGGHPAEVGQAGAPAKPERDALSEPYLVGRAAETDIAGMRRWADLERRVEVLHKRDPEGDGLLIPRSVAHDLREGLCLGREVAEARLRVLRRRYAGDERRRNALDALAKDAEALAGLPDAMAALAFLPPAKESKERKEREAR